MIYKRAVARLRAQDWLAIAIELIIVIVGVFIGTLVANWNQDRIDNAQTRRMVAQLGPTLDNLNRYWPLAHKYYGITRSYGDVAIAGWHNDPAVTDAQFVLAAYQASQIYIIGMNGSAFSKVLGEDRLAQIDDPQLRADLNNLMTNDYSQIDFAALDTPYRHGVRRLIPIDVQDAIRRQCGDRLVGGDPTLLYLPTPCLLQMPADRIASSAATLRLHRELLADLQEHLSRISVLMENIRGPELWTRRVAAQSAALDR